MSLHFQCTWRQFNSGNAKNNVRSNCKDVFPQSVRGLLTVDSHTHKDPAFSRVLTRLRGFFSTLSGMWTIDQIGWWFTSHVKKCAGKNSRYNDKKSISDSPNYLDGSGCQFLGTLFLDIFFTNLIQGLPKVRYYPTTKDFSSSLNLGLHSGDLIYCYVEVCFFFVDNISIKRIN